MKTEFVIYKGDIKFLNNHIKIRDGIFKWQKKMSMAYSTVLILGGGFMVIKHLDIPQDWALWVGLGIIAVSITGIIAGLKVNMDNDLDLQQVEKAVISENFASYLNLTLYLKNSQKRKVVLDYRDEDKFAAFYQNDLIETLKSCSINTEVR
jgi:hypothetical protein